MSNTELTKTATKPDPDLIKAAHTLAGQTIIRSQVNQKIVQAATAETLRVSPEDVKVNLFDDRGKIGFEITTLIRHDDILRCAVRPDQSAYGMVQQARQTIVQKVGNVAGLKVGTVNILLAGTKKTKVERVLK